MAAAPQRSRPPSGSHHRKGRQGHYHPHPRLGPGGECLQGNRHRAAGQYQRNAAANLSLCKLNQPQKCSGNTCAGACMSLNKSTFSKSTVQVGPDGARCQYRFTHRSKHLDQFDRCNVYLRLIAPRMTSRQAVIACRHPGARCPRQSAIHVVLRVNANHHQPSASSGCAGQSSR